MSRWPGRCWSRCRRCLCISSWGATFCADCWPAPSKVRTRKQSLQIDRQLIVLRGRVPDGRCGGWQTLRESSFFARQGGKAALPGEKSVDVEGKALHASPPLGHRVSRVIEHTKPPVL